MKNIFQGNDLLSGVTTEGPTNSFSLGRPVLLSDILLIPSVHSFPESHPSQASCFLPVAALSGSPPTVPPTLSTASSTCLMRVHTGLRAGASPTFQKGLLPHVQVGRRLPHFPHPIIPELTPRKVQQRRCPLHGTQMTLRVQNGVYDERKEHHGAPGCSVRRL